MLWLHELGTTLLLKLILVGVLDIRVCQWWVHFLEMRSHVCLTKSLEVLVLLLEYSNRLLDRVLSWGIAIDF